MIPGPAAVCSGTVVHRRDHPRVHRFTQRVSQVWIDPDDPAQLCDLHPGWSDRRPAPARFRRRDYGLEPTGSLAQAARDDLTVVLDRTPRGPVRMLTQLRRWGWLFNPITFYFVWDHADDETPGPRRPVGAVLEVTNTPWKERTRYPVALAPSQGRLCAAFDKGMHVSPFLGMDHRYRLQVHDRDDVMAVDLDVVDTGDTVVLHTSLRLRRRPATRRVLGRSLWSEPFPTHRVSAAIHHQAARLWAKGVPFVAHPDTTTTTATRSPTSAQEDR